MYYMYNTCITQWYSSSRPHARCETATTVFFLFSRVHIIIIYILFFYLFLFVLCSIVGATHVYVVVCIVIICIIHDIKSYMNVIFPSIRVSKRSPYTRSSQSKRVRRRRFIHRNCKRQLQLLSDEIYHATVHCSRSLLYANECGRSYAKLLDNRVRTMYTRVFLQIHKCLMLLYNMQSSCVHGAGIALYRYTLLFVLLPVRIAFRKPVPETRYSTGIETTSSHHLDLNGLHRTQSISCANT